MIADELAARLASIKLRFPDCRCEYASQMEDVAEQTIKAIRQMVTAETHR